MTGYLLTGVLFWAGLLGAAVFAAVLGGRAYDAHTRGIARIHHDTRKATR